jgi:molybdenum cofactor biosynthesis protein A
MEAMPGNKIHNQSKLIDRFGRIHNYLRISITEKCNFRCLYCMPDENNCLVNSHILTPNEIESVAISFIKLGIDKIRLTGGEPLVRNDFKAIVEKLGPLCVTKSITTNGFLLDKYIGDLQKNGIHNINISLDSLRPERFFKITQREAFSKIYENIFLAISEGFNVKINAVIMRGFNEDELLDFARISVTQPVSVRFIEFMPFKQNNWNFGKTVKHQEMLSALSKEFQLIFDGKSTESAATYYKIPGSVGNIGIIGTVSQPFCDSCNRIRVTSDGKIKSCLFGTSELDLLQHLKNSEDLSEVIRSAISKKPFQQGDKSISNINSDDSNLSRSMYSIGG